MIAPESNQIGTTEFKDVVTLLFWRQAANVKHSLDKTLKDFQAISIGYRKLVYASNQVNWPVQVGLVKQNNSVAAVLNALLYLDGANHKIFYTLYGYSDRAILTNVINTITSNIAEDKLIEQSNIILSKGLTIW